MDDEGSADVGPKSANDAGECSGDSCKSAGPSNKASSRSALSVVGEKVRKLHNGEPEHVSSDEESVVEENAANFDNDNVEKESLDSEEEDFKLHVDVDVSSDQDGSDVDNVDADRRSKRDQSDCDGTGDEPVCILSKNTRVNSVEDENEVIELSAGEDDDCEVLEIKAKDDNKDQNGNRQEEVVERKKNDSMEVVDLDDSAELDLEIDQNPGTRDRGMEEIDDTVPSAGDDGDVEETEMVAGAADVDDDVEMEETEEQERIEGRGEKNADHDSEMVEVSDEKIEGKSEDAGELEVSPENDMNVKDVTEIEEQGRRKSERVVDAGAEDDGPMGRDSAEVADPRTTVSDAGDRTGWGGNASAEELSDSEDFVGFGPSEVCHSFVNEFCLASGSETNLADAIGTLHVSADSLYYTPERGEGLPPTSGSEAGDSNRFSPAPTDSSRCNSPSMGSVSGERRSGRKRFSLDVNNPVYMKPFELGWKRELVYRSSLDSSNRRMADVYYYTPNNRKVRSAREIVEYVDGIELTTKNFLFTKEPMGLDSSKETIRDAKKTPNVREGKDDEEEEVALPPAPKKSVEKQKSPKVAETAPTPVAPKSPLGQASNSSPAVGQRKAAASTVQTAVTPVAGSASTTSRSFPRIKVTPTRLQKDGAGASVSTTPASKASAAAKRAQLRPLLPKPREEPSQDLEMGMLPPLWSTKPSPKKASVSTTWSSTPKMVSEPLAKKTDPCSIHCPLKMGVIPTLQCRLCVCLYHPECVGLAPFAENIQNYICKNCKMDITEGKTSLVPPVKCPVLPKPFPASMGPPPLSPTSTIPLPVAPHGPPSIRQMDPGKVAPDTRKLVTVPRFVKTRDVFAPQGGKPPGKKILGSVTTWLPSSASVQMPKTAATAATSCEPVSSSAPASMQSVAWMNGRKYIVVPKHNVLSVSPSPGDKAPTQSQVVITSSPSSGERTLNVVPGGKEPGMLLGNPPGVLLVPLLPPADKGSALQTQYLIVNAPPGGGLILPAPPPTPLSDTGKERGRKRSLSADEGPPSKQVCTEEHVRQRVHPMQNFMNDVCVVYNVFQHVFQYLKVQELLRAVRVCRLWRDLAQHHSLWSTVHMKNSKVSDWEGLANTLRARRTTHLDLRKMLLPQHSDEVAHMWKQFCLVIDRIDCLERLDLCRCPASVVQHVLTACPNLRTINATAISCNSILLQDAGNLRHLEELRLKSLSGITLETSLGVLSKLSNLKHLALTTFRNLGHQDVDVIGSLENLELLELGEVNNLPASFPSESLSKLNKLRRLRLEKVQGLDALTFNYLETARSLPQLTQLELVNFDVKPGFDTILASCSNIRKLLIIPTYVTQSATTNRMVLGGVLQLAATLQQFVWGVTHELLRVTELFVDQCDVDQLKKEQLKKGDCIPVLKPVPGIAAVHSPSDNWSCEEKYGGPTPSVEILSLPKLHKLLNLQLPTTKVKLLKIPFHATWRQYLSDMHT